MELFIIFMLPLLSIPVIIIYKLLSAIFSIFKNETSIIKENSIEKRASIKPTKNYKTDTNRVSDFETKSKLKELDDDDPHGSWDWLTDPWGIYWFRDD